MSIFGACMLFVALILVYVVIVEIFTMLFRFTGLTAEKARFQVVSLLTNSGYTTRESELITVSPVRRRLARATMMFGYAFTVTIVSSVVNVFLSLKLVQLEHILWQLFVPALFLIALILFFRNKRFKQCLDGVIERVVNRLVLKGARNQLLVLDYFADKVVAQVTLKMLPQKLADTRLADANLNDKGVLLLLVQRKGRQLSAVDADTVLHPGDHLVVFGPLEAIRDVFEAAPCLGSA
ncbi:MAG: TrkA C-terminal domain-containing protein [Clostridia bacterium]